MTIRIAVGFTGNYPTRKRFRYLPEALCEKARRPGMTVGRQGLPSLGGSVMRRVVVLLFALVVALSAAVPALAAGRKGGGDGRLAAHSLRSPVSDEAFYFVMADRFENGDTANDLGGLPNDRLVSGFDPTAKGFYHGGDLKGLLQRIDYIRGLGATSIWLTPSFKNKAVQLEDGPS